MSVDLSHLLAQYRPHALLPDDERIQWIQRDRWIHYSRAEHVLDRLTALLNCPPRNRMPCLLIFGSTGMGKTQAVQKFVRDHRSSLPVVTIQMPPAPHERDLYEEIMVAMGGVLVMGLGITTLRHRTRVLARQLGVRMIIIDEIHSILPGTFREQRIILNAIRFLANDLRISIVCVGTHDAKQALMTDQQLADRFEGIELPRWEDDSTYHQLLSSFSAILPLRCASDLLDIKVRKQILILSEGVMVRICRLLEAAAIEAIRNRTESIHLGSLNSELIAQSLVSVSDRSSRRVTG